MWDVNKIADFLLVETRERGEALTNLKLQKLLYYAQAWHLALYGQSLYQEELKAWVHGPVVVSQYHRFKKYGWKPILDELVRPTLDDRTVLHLQEIIDVFGSESAVALELMTHRERPWIEARKGIAAHEASDNVISKEVMREYYGTAAAQA